MSDAGSYASAFVVGRHAEVLSALERLSLAERGLVASRIAELVVRDAVDRGQEFPRPRLWIDQQEAFVALAALPGVNAEELASALVTACQHQRVDGKCSPLEPTVFAWMMRHAEDVVYERVGRTEPAGTRFLRAALWCFEDERARRWMLDLFQRTPAAANGLYQDMRAGRLRSHWSPPEWTARALLLSEARLPKRPFRLDQELPRATSSGQVRLACAYARDVNDELVHDVVTNVRRYRTGDPRLDAELFSWRVDDARERDTLRLLLELAGPAGTREALVAEAPVTAAELVASLLAPVARPPWADETPTWQLDGWVDAGVVDAPDGEVSGVDPHWAFEGLPFVVAVAPGRYPVQLLGATHSREGQAFAAARLVVEDTRRPQHWVRAGGSTEGAYGAASGFASFGSRAALEDESLDLPTAPQGGREHVTVESDTGATAVLFSAHARESPCRSWIGLTADGDPACVLTDLGLVHIDPLKSPADPLQPHAAPAVAPTRREPVPGVVETATYEPKTTGVPGPVTVLEFVPASHSWLRADSVWVRHEATRSSSMMLLSDFLAD